MYKLFIYQNKKITDVDANILVLYEEDEIIICTDLMNNIESNKFIISLLTILQMSLDKSLDVITEDLTNEVITLIQNANPQIRYCKKHRLIIKDPLKEEPVVKKSKKK